MLGYFKSIKGSLNAYEEHIGAPRRLGVLCDIILGYSLLRYSIVY